MVSDKAQKFSSQTLNKPENLKHPSHVAKFSRKPASLCLKPCESQCDRYSETPSIKANRTIHMSPSQRHARTSINHRLQVTPPPISSNPKSMQSRWPAFSHRTHLLPVPGATTIPDRPFHAVAISHTTSPRSKAPVRSLFRF